MKYNRRTFMRSALTGTGLLLANGRAWAVPAPSERITVASIGVGGMGMTDLGGMLRTPEAQVVAVCDVDSKRREQAKFSVENFYSEEQAKGAYKGCEQYGDFRDLVAREDIDAVVIATPDHWHALIAIEALKAGKDVYCEKPLALTIDEGKAIVKAVQRYGRVFQLGTQNRSNPLVRRICELVRNGVIGRVKRVQVGIPPLSVTPPQPIMPVPEELDYDMWLGPAPWAPYTKKRCHGTFRIISDYSGGPVTDLGTHYMDVMQWACGLEETGPISVKGEGVFPKNAFNDLLLTGRFFCQYEDGPLVEGSTDYIQGCRFEGTEGWIFLPLGFPGPESNPVTKVPEASDPLLLDVELGPDAVRLRKNDNHHATFINCVRTRRETAAPVEAGHHATNLCHLGNIAMRLGRSLKWDPVQEVFPDDAEANAMLSRAMRSPWRLS